MSSLLVLLMFSWLTVGLPFVAEASENGKTELLVLDEISGDGETEKPPGKTGEQKSGGGLVAVPDLLPDGLLQRFSTLLISSYTLHLFDLYKAYHPERIIPPPEA